jgi:hypothetical protein
MPDVELTADVAGISQNILHRFSLTGPAQIKALATDQIRRRSPISGEMSAEHNLFPFVEFSDPGLPWRYTPTGPHSTGALAPWLVLVAVKDEPPNIILPAQAGRVQLSIGQDSGKQLPTPSEAWLWAHVHEEEVSGGRFARLMCPTRLERNTNYICALVPLFEGGKLAGLGQAVDLSTAHLPAWNTESGAISLPVYDHWRFKTGDADFEELARRLFPSPPSDRFGRVKMDLKDPAPGFSAAELGVREKQAERDFAGAFVAVDSKEAIWHAEHKSEFQDALAKVFKDRPDRAASRQKYDPKRHDPVITPPGYGRWASPQAPLGSIWAEQANLDPKNRAVAGLASRAFRARQEEYIALAWRALAENAEKTTVARRKRAAAHVSTAIYKRTQALSSDTRLQLTRPQHRALRDENGISLKHRLKQDKAVPDGLVEQSFSRFSIARLRAVLKPKGDDITTDNAPNGFAEETLSAALAGNLSLASFSHGLSARTRTDYAVSIDVPGGLSLESSPTEAARSARGLPRSGRTGAATRRLSVNAATEPQTREAIGRLGPGTVAVVVDRTPAVGLNLTGAVTYDAVPPTPVPPVPAGPIAGPQPSAALQAHLAELDEELKPMPLALAAFHRASGLAVVRAYAAQPIPKEVKQIIRFSNAAVTDMTTRAPKVFAPGVESLPLNGVGLVQSNPAFVAAYMLGLNHETAREFAWRGVPVPLNQTWFNTFWDYVDEGRTDIPDIAGWPAAKGLRGNLVSSSKTSIILVRAELLQRYPETVIYAVPAHFDGRKRVVRQKDFKQAISPSFQGVMGPGLRYVGFDQSPEKMLGAKDKDDLATDPGWFIVFEQPAFAPAFGLDALANFRQNGAPASADGLEWGDFARDESDFITLRQPRGDVFWAGTEVDGFKWGRSSSDIAALCFQRPVRVMIHADRLVG